MKYLLLSGFASISFGCADLCAQDLPKGAIICVVHPVDAPKVVSEVEPEYPKSARETRTQGTVVVAIVVDVKGNVRDPRVVKGVNRDLDRSALAAVKKWKFKPASRKGEPVAARVNVEVSFKL